MAKETQDRLVLPIFVPLFAAVAIVFVVLALSRILLAVPHDPHEEVGVATPIALAMALNILTGAALIASLPRLRSGVIKALLVLGAIALAGGGLGAMVVSGELEEIRHAIAERGAPEEPPGEPGAPAEPGVPAEPGEPAEPGAPTDTIVALNIAFDLNELRFPADEEFVLTFDNQEAVPHNVSIFTEEGGDILFEGEIITDTTIDYTIPPLEAGRYFFHCDLHPTMKGSVVVG